MTQYIKLLNTSEEGLLIEPAPIRLISNDIEIFNPTDEQYLQFGYKKLITPPELSGYEIICNKYIELDTSISIDYSYKKLPDPVYTYSKLRCVEKLIEKGYWVKTKQFIENNNLYDLYLAAQDFTSDNKWFKIGVESLSIELSITQSELNEILDYAKIEE